jgi:hypothetical protein
MRATGSKAEWLGLANSTISLINLPMKVNGLMTNSMEKGYFITRIRSLWGDRLITEISMRSKSTGLNMRVNLT